MAARRREETGGRTSHRNNKAVYSWGANSHGQLAQGNKEDQLQPTEFSPPVRIKYVTGGGAHTLVISDDGTLWSCGSNSVGQLGQGTRCEEFTLKKVKFLNRVKVTDVAGGWDFSLACTDDGKLFVWGSNLHGQLGSYFKCSVIPVEVELDYGENVSSVAAGLRHSALCTTTGHVYCAGNNKKGQCGVGKEAIEGQKVCDFEQVPLPEGCGKPIRVVCGSYHTAALTDTGRVLVWGCNKNGISTQHHTAVKVVDTPYLVSQDVFNGAKITSLHSGWCHMLAQTDTGEVYSWGSGMYGKLGRAHTYTQSCDPSPGLVPELSGAQSLCCGSEHNLTITKDGFLMAWGWNEHGICGNPDEINILQPMPVAALDGRRVSLIGCGAGTSFAVVEPTRPDPT